MLRALQPQRTVVLLLESWLQKGSLSRSFRLPCHALTLWLLFAPWMFNRQGDVWLRSIIIHIQSAQKQVSEGGVMGGG